MRVKLLDEECMPYKYYLKDAGVDLRCRVDTVIYPGFTEIIPAGICVEIPEGFVGDISPRSSISTRGIVIQGKIDPGYTGEVGIIAANTTNAPVKLKKGDRIAQLILIKIACEEIEIVSELSASDRNDNGFGSTGRD